MKNNATKSIVSLPFLIPNKKINIVIKMDIPPTISVAFLFFTKPPPFKVYSRTQDRISDCLEFHCCISGILSVADCRTQDKI